MMNKHSKTAIALSVCTTLAAAINTAHACVSIDQSPFATQDLGAGYRVADSHVEGKCGEGKCGGKKGTEGKCGEGKCGGDKDTKEGKCGEGKCGGEKKNSKEGKCGEGKCGSSK